VRLNRGLLILFCIFLITRVSIPELLDCESLDASDDLRLLGSTFKILDNILFFISAICLILVGIFEGI
jgi:hypothetical protein